MSRYLPDRIVNEKGICAGFTRKTLDVYEINESPLLLTELRRAQMEFIPFSGGGVWGKLWFTVLCVCS